MKSLFEGTGVAIVTPFRNGKVDYKSLGELINKDIVDGAKAIIVLGTTGEGVSVNSEERKEIIRYCKSAIKGRAKLIVGTGNNNFIMCQENTIMAKFLGADGVLIVTPYYNKTTQRGLVKYYERLAEIGIPIIMYNVPSRTGLNLEIDTVKELLDNKMIYGLKESTCDINRIIELSSLCKDKIALYSGEDALNYVFYVLGANGCISVTANFLTDKVDAVFNYVQNGDFKKALQIQNELKDINQAMFIETNPIPVKNLMYHMDMIDDEVRMPLVRAEDKTSSLLNRLAKRLKEEKNITF